MTLEEQWQEGTRNDPRLLERAGLSKAAFILGAQAVLEIIRTTYPKGTTFTRDDLLETLWEVNEEIGRHLAAAIKARSTIQ